MNRQRLIIGPILNPADDGTVGFFPDGAMTCDGRGIITFIGPAARLPASLASLPRHASQGIILPPFLDAHLHISQHPIRGHFMDGILPHPPEGRLIAGLNRNVFPAEAQCESTDFAERIVRDFARDALSHGVVGGAAYMTVHETATEIALSRLHEFWSVGLVLMEMNCPAWLRTESAGAESQMRRLGERFGRRFIVTDRFAVCVGSHLRKAASRVAGDLGLSMQTHLNEQLREKQYVEARLYPQAGSYTDVYRRDGLLDRNPILAHCVHMTDAELDVLADHACAVAHCPTSNTLLCSGTMPLDRIASRGIQYAICTDVGASPTTSILAEMAQFLKVHAGRSTRATPTEALYRATLAPAKILGLDAHLGSFAVGKPMSFIEVQCDRACASPNDAIRAGLLDMTAARPDLADALDDLAHNRLDVGRRLDLLDQDIRQTAARLQHKVISVTLAGEQIFHRIGRRS
jgi:guanine deaminase